MCHVEESGNSKKKDADLIEFYVCKKTAADKG